MRKPGISPKLSGQKLEYQQESNAFARSRVAARRIVVAILVCSLVSAGVESSQPEPLSNGQPLSPREEQTTFRILDGLTIELAASEPQVVDPVAIAFDGRGRMFVAEMRAYPNEGNAIGNLDSGRIRILEDRDQDGYYERSTVFADKLRLPTSVMPYRDGALVADAPNLLFCRDTNGDGKADVREVLYTGFDLNNIQQLPSALQWGLDNWVYACVGGQGGTIRCPQDPNFKPLVLRGRGFRFHPDRPGSLEATSGGGQFGLAATRWQQWLTATNSQHLLHIVLADQYIRRNPQLPVSRVTINIPDHGAACRVFRISRFEAWRVERTRRRKSGPGAKRFSPTELVPGGFITSACSPLVYDADLLPQAFHGNVLVCDPANNLIHRDRLEPRGATFVAKRADRDCEFLASTDNFFRPVNLAIGPDGAIYVADFYREVIETPRSLPPDIKKRVNLQSRNRGRIWRIRPANKEWKPRNVNLRELDRPALIAKLASPNAWCRLTAQRLIIERGDKQCEPLLRRLLAESKSPIGRAHALWTLHGLGVLRNDDIVTALRDRSPRVREQAIRVAEFSLAGSATVRQAAVRLANDEDFRVRWQLALSLGYAPGPEAAAALVRISRRDIDDSWMRLAVLTSVHGNMVPHVLAELVKDRTFTHGAAAHRRFLNDVVSLATASGSDAVLDLTIRQALKFDGSESLVLGASLLDAVDTGLRRRGKALSQWLARPPAQYKQTARAVIALAPRLRSVAESAKQPLRIRVAAIRILGHQPLEKCRDVLRDLLAPNHPQQVQLAAVKALAGHRDPEVAGILLQRWEQYSPTVRAAVVETMFEDAARLRELLRAVGAKKIAVTQIEPARLNLLRRHPNTAIRKLAAKVLDRAPTEIRAKVLERYAKALELEGDANRGRMVFRKNCAVCHRLEGFGYETGADLLAVLPGKTRETILIAILDPNREVDPRYLEYLVETKDGKLFNGRVMAETASSITLRRDKDNEHVILRSQIESIRSTAKSLMPEGLEKNVSVSEMADLLAYLETVVKKR